MRTSHVILKVNDLHRAVEDYREKGFTVEYGKKKNPRNALIYFSEGPYIEILDGTHMLGFLKRLLRLLGKGGVADRLDLWDDCPGGFCALALETTAPTLEREAAILRRHGQAFAEMNNTRHDTKDRQLRFRTLFPYDTGLPFFMTYFNIDPKPKAFVHENGIAGIGRIRFGTRPELIPLIRELCDDPILELFAGEGVEVEWRRQEA